MDLNDVAARTALLIMYELQLHGIDLESAAGPNPVVVLGDRHELQQVLLNLVTNAVQAVSALEQGRVRKIKAGDHPPGTATRCSGSATPGPAFRRT